MYIYSIVKIVIRYLTNPLIFLFGFADLFAYFLFVIIPPVINSFLNNIMVALYGNFIDKSYIAQIDYVASLVSNVLFGVIIGFIEWRILQKYLHISLKWMLLTILGIILGFDINIVISRLLNADYFPYELFILWIAISVIQLIYLHKLFKQAEIWVYINAIGWIVFYIIGAAIGYNNIIVFGVMSWLFILLLSFARGITLNELSKYKK